MHVLRLKRNVSRAACHVQTFLAPKQALLTLDQVMWFQPTKIYVPIEPNKKNCHSHY